MAAGGLGLILGGITPWSIMSPQPAGIAAPESVPDVPSLAPGDKPPAFLDRAPPTRIRIDAIGVDAAIEQVGLDYEGTIEVPDIDKPELAGWYSPGPSPGEVGPAAIVGHVDSRRSGAAVFYAIGGLEAGERIEIVRRDGTTAVFTVDLVQSYAKKEFPYSAVFTSTGYPALRLITCGGKFDERRKDYTRNIVVYATMDSTEQAD